MAAIPVTQHTHVPAPGNAFSLHWQQISGAGEVVYCVLHNREAQNRPYDWKRPQQPHHERQESGQVRVVSR